MPHKCPVSIIKRKSSTASAGGLASRESCLNSQKRLSSDVLVDRDSTRATTLSNSIRGLSRKTLSMPQRMTRTLRLIYFSWWWRTWSWWSRAYIRSKPCSKSAIMNFLVLWRLKLWTASSLSRPRLGLTPNPKSCKRRRLSQWNLNLC